MHELRITSRAYRDLADAVLWYQTNWSAEFAVRWYDGVLDRIEQLRSLPERHALAREDARVSFDLRELHYGAGRRQTHRVLFRVVGDTVEVLTIRHVAQQDVPPDVLS